MSWQKILVVSLLATVAPVAHASEALLQEVPVSSAAFASARSQSFTLRYQQASWVVPAAQATLWFKGRAGGEGVTLLQLRPAAIYDYLNRQVSPRVNTLGENSRFVRTGSTIALVGPGRKGTIVDGVKTSLAIRDALIAGKNTATVVMKEYRPAIFSAADWQKLSFSDHLAHGVTSFAGSPAHRIHNIQVGTARFNGVVVMPNEEFSFNQYLGTVDAANNYLPELVIKEHVTTPEYGGGICQVSTTAFRAALQAGLSITQRRNHSYPVRYYGTPGYDATVYAPSTDLRFVNDTGKPIHLTTAVQGTQVIFDIWGTSDGRQVTINGPFITERKPNGSLTAAIAQIVKKNGKSIREQNFVSRYQSPDKFPKVKAAGE